MESPVTVTAEVAVKAACSQDTELMVAAGSFNKQVPSVMSNKKPVAKMAGGEDKSLVGVDGMMVALDLSCFIGSYLYSR